MMSDSRCCAAAHLQTLSCLCTSCSQASDWFSNASAIITCCMSQRRTPLKAAFAVAQMRRLDWIQRHAYFDRFVKFNTKLKIDVQSIMNPDELLMGLSTGLNVSPFDIIVLKDKKRAWGKYVQPTLFRWFHVKKRNAYHAT